MIATVLAFTIVVGPAHATPTKTRAVFDFNKTEIAAYDGDDVYITRGTRTQDQLFRTDWTLRPRILVWSQPFPGSEITSVVARGGKVAVNLWNVTSQPVPKGSPDRVDTAVGLVDRDGSNPRVVTSATLLTESDAEEKQDNEPVSCGSHVEAGALSEDGTLFVERTIGTRRSTMCHGADNVNEYRLEQLASDGALSTHYSKSEKIDIAEDPYNGDITFGGILEMSTSGGFAAINDGDHAMYERLDGAQPQMFFKSPIHRGNGFFTTIVRGDGSIIVNDWRIGDGQPSEKQRIFLLASPNAKAKRIAPKLLDAKAVDCGGLIAVWREKDLSIKNDRAWIYSSTGDFKRIVKLPKHTLDAGCSGTRLATIQLKSSNRAVLSSLAL
jgi:hypothetical protein